MFTHTSDVWLKSLLEEDLSSNNNTKGPSITNNADRDTNLTGKSPDRSEAQNLVDRFTRQALHLHQHGTRVSVNQRQTWEGKLTETSRAMLAAFLRTGTRMEEYGWTMTAGVPVRYTLPTGDGSEPSATERVALATFLQAWELVPGLPDDADVYPGYREREAALSAAASTDDLAAVSVAAASLLDWAHQALLEKPLAA